MWVRGLKHRLQHDKELRLQVAPYVGAWIETERRQRQATATHSRTLCGCVD